MTDNTPIRYQNRNTLSFRQIDSLNGLTKGTSFRLFKHHMEDLEEGLDFLYLDGEKNGGMLEALKASAQIYQRTVHLVLITETGYARLKAMRPS